MKTDPNLPQPILDPDFQAAFVWNQAYRAATSKTGSARRVRIALQRSAQQASIFSTAMLPDQSQFQAMNYRFLERLLKFLLWQKGAAKILIEGAPELVPALQQAYGPNGIRAFDAQLIGHEVFGDTLQILAQEHISEPFPSEVEPAMAFGNHFQGARVGFDLGGSDRKCAAVLDGKVLYSEEIPWDPYFQADPSYHIQGIRDSIQRAAEKLPRLDAIGGSSAGIYVDNKVRVASLFRGIDKQRFEQEIQPLFIDIAASFGVPFVVVNDGEVTALAGAHALQSHPVLGIAMGTSQAAGYVNPKGKITDWLNELAFAPIDYAETAPQDEWSGDRGCGVQYFSQQAIARLLPKAGLKIPANLSLAEQLAWAQDKLKQGDSRLVPVYETIGTYLAYALAHYADFYELQHILLLGRVLSGQGGRILMETCQRDLPQIAPWLAETMKLTTPDENLKRHGQAVAAAGLPELD